LHFYINPDREVDAGAQRVHGISSAFLQDKPRFWEIQQAFWDFVEGSELVIHNAPFDLGFLNKELILAKWPKKLQEYCTVLDTLVLAKQKHPGQRNSLDALCKRYGIALEERKSQGHGALLDARLLARVYKAMTSGQIELRLNDVSEKVSYQEVAVVALSSQSPVIAPTEAEEEVHKAFLTRHRLLN
jgi:DNA polymerase-3 subunit epsilon